MGLPSIGGRQGKFEIDDDYKKRAQLELNKLDAIYDSDEEKKTAPEDNRSMQEVLRQKRLQTEQIVDEQNRNRANAPETLEERQARLKANRDLLKMHKKKQMEDELTQFNSKIQNQGDLYEELKNLDSKKKLPSEQEELERRRQILKGVKTEI